MKTKNFFHFLFVRLLVGVIIGIAIFCSSAAYLKKTYQKCIDQSFQDFYLICTSEVENYKAGICTKEELLAAQSLNTADYLRIVKVNYDSSFEEIYETDYDTIPVMNFGDTILVTKNDNMLGKYIKLDDGHVMEYRKCDKLWELQESQDKAIGNSYDLILSSGVFNIGNEVFQKIATYSFDMQYSDFRIDTYYVDFVNFYIGKVTGCRNLKDFFQTGEKKLFARKWDFTDPAYADRYFAPEGVESTRVFISDGTDKVIFSKAWSLMSFRMCQRPDKYFEQEGDFFFAPDLNYFYTPEYYDARVDKFRNEHFYTSEHDLGDGHISKGSVILDYIDDQRYIFEYVITYVTYDVFFRPYLITLAVVLFILCCGLPCLFAFRAYKLNSKTMAVETVKDDHSDPAAETADKLRETLQAINKHATDLKAAEAAEEKDASYTAILEKLTELDIGIDNLTDNDNKGLPS